MREIRLPVDRATLATLTAGDEVALTGEVYTARDATHVRIVEAFERDGVLPFGLEGATIFYAGPTPPAAGRPAGAIGPTTAKRMDAWTPELLRAGVVATIGKGVRSRDVVAACVETGSVYFAAVGGGAASLARHVTAMESVAWPDLGAEALVRMELDAFPVYVAIDAKGRDLYELAAAEWRS
jgi:fumarate hydratase subunit beta